MAAVMKDNKYPDQKGSGQDCQRDEQPPGNRQTSIHQVPKQRIGTKRVDHLPHGPRRRGLLVFRNDVLPDCRIGLAFGQVRLIHGDLSPFPTIS